MKLRIESGAIVRNAGRRICWAQAAVLLFAVPGSVHSNALPAQSEAPVQGSNSSAVRLIQGRITEIDGDHVTVKTPDGYPGGPGIHAHFVTAGPLFDVDIGHSRILLADGKQTDAQPLQIGDRVAMLLREPEPESGASAAPPGNKPLYHALIVERTVMSDRIVTH